MRALYATCILFLAALTPSVGQGFDWQYSARVPTSSPIRFLGGEIMSGWTLHTGPLPYIQTDLGLECCRYENGAGLPMSVGVGGEYWITGDVALMGTVGYRSQGALFTADGDTLPRAGQPPVITQYELSARLHYATIVAGAKLRLFETHLTVGVGFRLMMSIGSSSSQQEQVVQPSDYTFQNGSTVMTLTTTSLNDLKPFIVIPYIQLGYDISMDQGMYLSPTLSLGIPLMSVTSDASWHMTDLGVGVRLMKGF